MKDIVLSSTRPSGATTDGVGLSVIAASASQILDVFLAIADEGKFRLITSNHFRNSFGHLDAITS